MPAHDQHMQRAIALASQAEGCTSPNPLVGCVVVNNEVVVGEGWHHAAGLAHAEVNALKQAGDAARGATLYVTLEPCTHQGRTPPCTNAIVKAGVATVVYAVADPNPVATGGATVLQDAGIEVIGGVLAAEAQHMNRFYLHFQQTRRPYIVAKYAASLDGRIATRSGHSQWITGPQARQRGHQLRQAVDAIIVGAQTVIDDNPSLTVRLEGLPSAQTRHPLRVVLDSRGRIPLDRHLFDPDLPGNTLVFTTDAMTTSLEQSLSRRGVAVKRIGRDLQQRVDLDTALQELSKLHIQSAMVEGGQELLGSFLDAEQINEVWAFLAPMLIGGTDARQAIGGLGIDRLEHAAKLVDCATEQVGDDWLVRGQIRFLQESA